MTRKKKTVVEENTLENLVPQGSESSREEAKDGILKVVEPDYDLARHLEGIPKVFPDNKSLDLEILCDLGIAANFGKAGWARGFAWRTKVFLSGL